ncbi:LPS-assembly protein LptD [Coxiella burnetii]|uniref:LPS-assembly protein LptD n=1 Tax=Coxiella burnetii TaxID=777 RepID=UPI0000ECFEB8|nr:LPS-assembly protein LptD [Coxiella burnetii]ACJ21128.1 organic solvent tolerance protein [Coxiella burnetii CbuK_Q154]EAX33689.1 LPS biosynthesis protein [Coxiella burnetii 'MSU Goat Q177']UYK69650.1 LPS-assembly protein LptD [Coxiella burnetii]
MKQGKSFIFYCLVLLLCGFQQLSSAVTASIAKAIKTTDRKQRVSETLPTGLSYRRFYQHIAHLLGWVPAPDLVCRGYFKEPLILTEHPHPGPATKEPAIVTAKGPSMVTAQGVSILRKDVVVTQPGRIVEADKAYIYRDSKTGHVTKIILIGHVRLHEADKRIVADKGTLTLYPKTAILMNAAYHIYNGEPYFYKFKYPFDAWGIAKHAVRDASNVITLRHATYSTCKPTAPAWSMSATTLVLNRNTHRGEAYNMLLHIGRVPIFYFPYFNFPIDNYRKTGFLIPYAGHSSSSGWFFALPFYWNMAPNYDLTLTPEFMSERGLNLQSLFRFLSTKSSGTIYLNYLPNDKVFQQFRETTLSKFPPSVLAEHPVFIPYVDKLKKMKNQRAFFSMNETTLFNSEWSSQVILNYVTDPYFFQDLGGQLGGSSLANQLLNQIDLQYNGLHWQFMGMLQAYQTLHLISQWTTPALDQYSRLPDFNIVGYYPDIARHVDFNFNAEAVNFDYRSDFVPDKPRGQRFHMRPGISFPFYFASGYIIPQLWADATAYNITHFQPGQAHTSSRLLPIFDIDSGLYFDRNFHLGHRSFIQTLEPRFFYLYVPYQNQDRFPNFDTVLLPFSFEQLFALNQFTDNDRLQNANQASFALTSRVLDAQNGSPILTANVGFIYYLENQRVCLTPGCTPSNYHYSPIIGELTFYPFPYWSFTGSLAWDPNLGQTNNTSVELAYNNGGKKADIRYLFVHGNEDSIVTPTTLIVPGNAYSQNTNHVISSGAWPLLKKWNAVGYWDYNITERRTDVYSIGVQYNTCCWALSFSIRRTYAGLKVDPNGALQRQYDTAYGFELQLKGLGNLGTAPISTVTVLDAMNNGVSNDVR